MKLTEVPTDSAEDYAKWFGGITLAIGGLLGAWKLVNWGFGQTQEKTGQNDIVQGTLEV